ncbi:MAG: alpha/beta fold hydrolase [Acidobacteriota bacterium]
MPKLLTAHGIEICYEVIGADRPGSPILLIMGLGAQMIMWPDPFCEMLAARGHPVIRFDNRDSGGSSRLDHLGSPSLWRTGLSMAVGRPVRAPYPLLDLARDSVALLDGLGIAAAHVVGISMGAMIAQLMAIHHAGRVRTLVSMMSGTGNRRTALPRPGMALRLMRRPKPRREAYIEFLVGKMRLFNGPHYGLDEDRLREVAGRVFDRGLSPGGFNRQVAAVYAAPDRRESLARLRVPTLVIHGTADPLIRPAAGRETAETIPGARLLMIEGMGHYLPPALWPRIAGAIAEHVARGAGPS